MVNYQNAKRLGLFVQRLLVVGLFCLCASFGFAQNKLTGNIVDAAGEPIIGASVVVEGVSGTGAVSDLDGNFTLSNVPANATLSVSYIGFVTQKVNVGGRSHIKVTLVEDSKSLDELVVVGYGVQRKSDVTGALAHLGSEELTQMPVSNVLEAMQGKAAGVDITNSQRPGSVGSITIRGSRSIGASNDPLYVVDGMVIQNGGIDNINPQDIESIEVLKDASATAIYGSRGANGVVLVTTKKGQAGRLTLNYSGTVTFSKMSEVADYMDAAEWLQYSRLAKYNNNAYNSTLDENGYVIPDYTADKNAYGSVAASWANIDQAWVDGVYHPELVGNYDWVGQGKQTGITHEHTLSASGGTDRFKGYGSFGYLSQEGTQPGQEYSRFTANTSVEFTPLDYFTMGMTMNASYAHQDYGYSFSKSVTGAGDYYGALRGMLPWTVPYDENGDYIRNPNGDVNIINPIDELNYNTNQRRTFRISGSFYANVDFGKIWKPLEGLSYRLQFGPELRFYNVGVANAAEGINGDGNNKAQVSDTHNRSWTLDNLIYYNKTIAEDHHIGVTLMQSASKYHSDGSNMTAKDVATADELWYNLSSSADLTAFGSSLTESQMASYMARVNYNYKDRYLLTASVRWDGSSVLAEGNKWATFPSLALAWRIDQEKFMEKLPWISQLKLRLGYGVTGNAAISAYATKGALQSSYYPFGGNATIGYVPSDASAKTPNKMANQDLGWERTTQYNLGVDFGFLDNRISGSFDIYRTETKDLLLAMSIPSLTGYTSTYANVGKTKGWGIDVQLNAIPVKTKDFQWNTTLTWSMDRDEIKELANGVSEDVNNKWFVGSPISVFYDYVYDGIWGSDEEEEAAAYGRKPGQIKVKDLDQSGSIDATNDRAIVGHARPDWSGGWNNTFTYKNFELSAFIVARWGFTVAAGSATLDGRYMMRKVDYWVKGSNEDAEYYSPGSNGESADTYASSMNYQDGSYIKMRNISLGYNFTPKQLKPLGLNALKVYVQAQNPFSIYKATDWLDTDLVNYSNNTTAYTSEVTIKSWVIGVNIGF